MKYILNFMHKIAVMIFYRVKPLNMKLLHNKPTTDGFHLFVPDIAYKNGTHSIYFKYLGSTSNKKHLNTVVDYLVDTTRQYKASDLLVFEGKALQAKVIPDRNNSLLKNSGYTRE